MDKGSSKIRDITFKNNLMSHDLMLGVGDTANSIVEYFFKQVYLPAIDSETPGVKVGWVRLSHEPGGWKWLQEFKAGY